MLKQLTAATLLLSAVTFSPRIYAEILEQVLVKVNGEIITKTEFEARQVAELRNRPELANVLAGGRRSTTGGRRNHAGSDPRGRRRVAARSARPRTRLRARAMSSSRRFSRTSRSRTTSKTTRNSRKPSSRKG